MGWWKEMATGLAVYWLLRIGQIVGLVMFAFFVSIELAGPNALSFGPGE